MRYRELKEARLNLVTMFRGWAWDTLKDNLAQNESELQDFVDDYEDEYGEIEIPRARQFERGIELSDPKFAAWCKEKVEQRATELAHEFQSLIKNGAIKGWRAIVAPRDWKPSGPNPGIHWSRYKAGAVAHFGMEDDDNVTYVIAANIPLSSINWESTFMANMSEEFGVDEDEITIFEEAPVVIIKVTMQN